MASWTAPDTPASQRVAEVHRDATGREPAHCADAPGTFIVVGENADHFGGITVAGLTGLRTAVAISPRQDSTISVHAEFAGATTSDTASCGDIAALGEAGFTSFSGDNPVSNAEAQADHEPNHKQGSESTAPPIKRGLAVRFGGLVHTLVGRQMLSRDTAGMDVTVVSDIPLGSGLGALHAADTALALALMADDDDIDAAPLRARLAEIDSQSAKTYSDLPVLRARHSAALRGAEDVVSVIDYSDGSLTKAPHPARTDIRIISVASAFGEPFTDPEKTVERGRGFIDDACANFGVSSLRQLPDAPERVVEWVDARRHVHGADSAPDLDTARAWVAFSETETQQSAAAAKALRSMRGDELFGILRDHGLTPGLPVPHQLVELLELRGARAARPAAAGMSQAVLAYVDAQRADNIIADLADDGLAVVEITPGSPAEVLQ